MPSQEILENVYGVHEDDQFPSDNDETYVNRDEKGNLLENTFDDDELIPDIKFVDINELSNATRDYETTQLIGEELTRLKDIIESDEAVSKVTRMGLESYSDDDSDVLPTVNAYTSSPSKINYDKTLTWVVNKISTKRHEQFNHAKNYSILALNWLARTLTDLAKTPDTIRGLQSEFESAEDKILNLRVNATMDDKLSTAIQEMLHALQIEEVADKIIVNEDMTKLDILNTILRQVSEAYLHPRVSAIFMKASQHKTLGEQTDMDILLDPARYKSSVLTPFKNIVLLSDSFSLFSGDNPKSLDLSENAQGENINPKANITVYTSYIQSKLYEHPSSATLTMFDPFLKSLVGADFKARVFAIEGNVVPDMGLEDLAKLCVSASLAAEKLEYVDSLKFVDELGVNCFYLSLMVEHVKAIFDVQSSAISLMQGRVDMAQAYVHFLESLQPE